MAVKNNVRIVQYHYNDVSIRIWFSNHEVHEYTIDQVGPIVFYELKRLADAGRGLGSYLQTPAAKAFVPRKWKEWLHC